MTALILSLAAAMAFGGADYLGGATARRSSPMTVALLSQVTGLAVAGIMVLIIPGVPSREAFFWGALSGLAGSSGLILYFRALSSGTMGVVAPLSAMVGAALPVSAGVLIGERPDALAIIGIVTGVVATVLVSMSSHGSEDEGNSRDSADADATRKGVIAATIAGVCFGIFFLALDQAPADSGLWPLLGGRLAGVPIIGTLVLVTKPNLGDRVSTGNAVMSGAGDIVGNALFLTATRVGMLTLTSVVTSMYPVVVVILARLLLNEVLNRTQVAGVALALLSTALIAV